MIEPLESLAIGVRPVTATPFVPVWFAGLVTVIVLPTTAQLNVAEPVTPTVSLAVTTTDVVPAAVGVPLIAPVVALIESPVGRLLADQVNGVFVTSESVAVTVIGAIAVPRVELCAPGEVTVTVLVALTTTECAMRQAEPSLE